MNLNEVSISTIVRSIQKKELSAREVVSHFKQRIETIGNILNAVTCLNSNVMAEADAVDKKIARGEAVGLLAGIPFGIKEMICTKGIQTTAASKMLANFIPTYDATAVARLKREGALVLGKVNQDEFAMGSSNENSYHGRVKNPWGLDYVPGGSSGGSAAAQASRLFAATLGTDTGGSVRQPSSFCGTVGVKPTYGRVSRFGVIAYASSMDQLGPIVNCVEDAALILNIICGVDDKDSTTSKIEVPRFHEMLESNLKNVKVGVIRELNNKKLHPDVQKTLNSAREAFERMGAQIIEFSMPLIDQSVPTYYIIATSEASSNLSRYDGVKFGYRVYSESLSSIDLVSFFSKTRGEGFGKEVKRRILLGTFCLSKRSSQSLYLKATQVRRMLTNEFIQLFKKCDVILSPVTSTPPFKLGEKANDAFSMYLSDNFTTASNLAGLPAMSLPFGISNEGFPIGVQLTGGHFQEKKMLNVAYALEMHSPVIEKRPIIY